MGWLFMLKEEKTRLEVRLTGSMGSTPTPGRILPTNNQSETAQIYKAAETTQLVRSRVKSTVEMRAVFLPSATRFAPCTMVPF